MVGLPKPKTERAERRSARPRITRRPLLELHEIKARDWIRLAERARAWDSNGSLDAGVEDRFKLLHRSAPF